MNRSSCNAYVGFAIERSDVCVGKICFLPCLAKWYVGFGAAALLSGCCCCCCCCCCYSRRCCGAPLLMLLMIQLLCVVVDGHFAVPAAVCSCIAPFGVRAEMSLSRAQSRTPPPLPSRAARAIGARASGSTAARGLDAPLVNLGESAAEEETDDTFSLSVVFVDVVCLYPRTFPFHLTCRACKRSSRGVCAVRSSALGTRSKHCSSHRQSTITMTLQTWWDNIVMSTGRTSTSLVCLWLMVYSRSVSYTHLTLPTIYSV